MTSPARLRAGFTLALSAALAVSAVPASQAADASSGGAGPDLKVRAVNAMIHAASQQRTAKTLAGSDTLQASPGSVKAAAADHSPDKGVAGVAGAPTLSPPTQEAMEDATCEDLGLDWTSTNDRVWLHWNSLGLDNYTILRQRDGGSWKQLGSVQAKETSFLDRTINPRGLFTYRLDADGISCELGYWVSMATADGWGIPDAAYGALGTGEGTGPVLMQDTYSYAMPSKLNGMDPAFSPNGRRLAASSSADGVTWQMLISSLGAGGQDAGLLSSSMPAGTMGAEPSWSPDGTKVVYTRYTVDSTTHEVTGSQLRVIDARTGSDKAVSGSTGLVQADWRSATTLITAGGGAGEGLFTIGATGGTPVAVAGTTSAGFPEVAPNGKTYFVQGDGTTFALKVMSTSGAISPILTSTTHYFESPRVSPDGTLFYVDIDLGVIDDPSDNTFSVMSSVGGTGAPEATAIGAGRPGGPEGFFGYDVRQPRSAGTSDYTGDANPEILGKDTSGRLFAYYADESSPVAGRTSMGGGWNMFNQIVAPGDLDGDNRADVLGRKPDGTLWYYHGLGSGKVSSGIQVGSGWSSYVLVAPGDFNGDGVADLLGRDSKFQLWLYPGTGGGHFGARTLVTSGWGGFSAIIGFGDFNFDGKADILGRERSTGLMYLYPGTGTGGITGRTKLGAGWNTINAFAAPEFLGVTPGLFGRRADGSMLYYQVVGDGRFDPDSVYLAGGGWSPFQITG